MQHNFKYTEKGRHNLILKLMKIGFNQIFMKRINFDDDLGIKL